MQARVLTKRAAPVVLPAALLALAVALGQATDRVALAQSPPPAEPLSIWSGLFNPDTPRVFSRPSHVDEGAPNASAADAGEHQTLGALGDRPQQTRLARVGKRHDGRTHRHLFAGD